jgi:hypothetical protein
VNSKPSASLDEVLTKITTVERRIEPSLRPESLVALIPSLVIVILVVAILIGGIQYIRNQFFPAENMFMPVNPYGQAPNPYLPYQGR